MCVCNVPKRNPHVRLMAQGRSVRPKRAAAVKRIINPRKDNRIKEVAERQESKKEEAVVKHVPKPLTQMFFQFNEALGPPYHVLLDTNFINFSVRNKLDIHEKMMDCLFAKCTGYITDCVMGELEKLGNKFKVALRVAKDPRFQRLTCTHKGTYADDCLVERVERSRIYIVATCDKDLKRRIRKIPGVPIMYITQRKYSIERLPDAYGAPTM